MKTSKLPKSTTFWFLIILMTGAALRLPQLSRRPMHTDEAVHAIKFGSLLENGAYRYDQAEYHGPTLNYLTLIPAYLTGAKSLEEVNEAMLRTVPLFFGLILIAGLIGILRWSAREPTPSVQPRGSGELFPSPPDRNDRERDPLDDQPDHLTDDQ